MFFNSSMPKLSSIVIISSLLLSNPGTASLCISFLRQKLSRGVFSTKFGVFCLLPKSPLYRAASTSRVFFLFILLWPWLASSSAKRWWKKGERKGGRKTRHHILAPDRDKWPSSPGFKGHTLGDTKQGEERSGFVWRSPGNKEITKHRDKHAPWHDHFWPFPSLS